MSSGAGDAISRRRWASSPAMLFTFIISFLFHVSLCMLPVRFLWIIGGARSRRSLRRRRELQLFVVLLPAVLPPALVPPAMSRGDSLAVALLWDLDSDPIVSLSGCRRSSQDVDLVQIIQLRRELRLQLSSSVSVSLGRPESHRPSCLAAPHLIGVRSKSITSTDLNLFGDASTSPPSKGMLSSLPWVLLDSGMILLRRRISGDHLFGVDVLYLFYGKTFPVVSAGTVLFRSSSPCGVKSLSPHPLPMARGTFSDLWSSFCFNSFIVLSSCGAVSTGPEDTSEATLVVLVDGVWTSTSRYVTILQLYDFVVKDSSTHSSFVSNSLSSSFEDLSCLTYLYDVFSVYCERGWIIPYLCTEEV